MSWTDLKGKIDGCATALRVLAVRNRTDSPAMSQVAYFAQVFAAASASGDPAAAKALLAPVIAQAEAGTVHLLAATPPVFDDASDAEVKHARTGLSAALAAFEAM